VFTRNEITRMALDVLRDAGEPLGVAEIAVRILAAKGLPVCRHHGSGKMTRAAGRVHSAGKRGVVRTVGVGQEATRLRRQSGASREPRGC
jgi:hypothetical protein